MTIAIGDRIPEARLSIMGEAGPRNIDSLDLFRGKRMVVFGVPGAFTPHAPPATSPAF